MKKITNALIAVLLLTSCPLVRAQQAIPQDIAKVVRVRGNARSIANAAGSYSGAHYTVSEELNAIVIRGKPDAVASVERTIQELDAMNTSGPASNGSARDVEVSAYVIGGSRDPLPGMEETSGDTLGPVVKQLSAVFPYKHYVTLATMLLRAASEGKANSQGEMPSLSRSTPNSYFIGFEVGHLIHEIPASVHLVGFRFSAQTTEGMPGTAQFVKKEVTVNTDVDLREGQKVIVGKANVANSDTCYFLVLSARLVP